MLRKRYRSVVILCRVSVHSSGSYAKWNFRCTGQVRDTCGLSKRDRSRRKPLCYRVAAHCWKMSSDEKQSIDPSGLERDL